MGQPMTNERAALERRRAAHQKGRGWYRDVPEGRQQGRGFRFKGRQGRRFWGSAPMCVHARLCVREIRTPKKPSLSVPDVAPQVQMLPGWQGLAVPVSVPLPSLSALAPSLWQRWQETRGKGPSLWPEMLPGMLPSLKSIYRVWQRVFVDKLDMRTAGETAGKAKDDEV